MSYLKFRKLGESYAVINDSEDFIAYISKMRNGKFMHWTLVIPMELMEECVDQGNALTFSPGCQDEIREFCKKLNGGKEFNENGDYEFTCANRECNCLKVGVGLHFITDDIEEAEKHSLENHSPMWISKKVGK